ncbi:MAG: hypothetical protein IKD53_04525 [Clostridia bacterium]|nr:hypothetical protein [Clostridia bacterium]
MRTGYAIRDRKKRAWLATRILADNQGGSLTVWVQSEEDALIFRKLPDAKRMLKAVRADSRWPNAIQIMDPRWREVG